MPLAVLCFFLSQHYRLGLAPPSQPAQHPARGLVPFTAFCGCPFPIAAVDAALKSADAVVAQAAVVGPTDYSREPTSRSRREPRRQPKQPGPEKLNVVIERIFALIHRPNRIGPDFRPRSAPPYGPRSRPGAWVWVSGHPPVRQHPRAPLERFNEGVFGDARGCVKISRNIFQSTDQQTRTSAPS